jgi:hypothetical protein
MTEVKQSLIQGAGRGVFATKNFSNGENVCFYDGYISKNLTGTERLYLLSDDIIGFMIPKNPNGVAQLINDGGNIVFDFDELNKMKPKNGIEHILGKIMEYYMLSDERRNVEVRYPPKNGSWFYAIRNIKKGEELYFRYGHCYWLDIQCEKSLNIRICKSVISLVGERHKKDCSRSRSYRAEKKLIATALKYLNEGDLDKLTFIDAGKLAQ